MVDGDYFNVISRGIDLAGSIAHYQSGKNLSDINFIAGLNKVDLSTPNAPKIIASKQKDEKIDYGIDGKYLGSMYANTVTLISTEEGVGVRHSGVIRGIEDVIVKVKDKAEFQAIDVNTNGSVKIDAKDIKTSLINADTIDLKASGKVTNEGLYKGKQIQINANNFENAKQTNLSQETKDIFKINQENSSIFADSLTLNTLDKTSNFGFINALNDIKVGTNSFDNQGEISANKDISLMLNDDAFINNGKILSKNDEEAKKIYKKLKERNITATNIVDNENKYEGGICVITSYLAKGLEFDGVIITDASEEKYSSEKVIDMKLLYVAMTRPLHELKVLYQKDITKPLREEAKK